VELYTAKEIAQAAGVPLDLVVRLMSAKYVVHADAVRIGRFVVREVRAVGWVPEVRGVRGVREVPEVRGDHEVPEVRRVREVLGYEHLQRRPLMPLLVSTVAHAGIAALMVFLAGLNFAPRAAVLRIDEPPNEMMRLVFRQIPGPGGGGGGGGLQQPKPAPKAMREGTRKISSPIPERKEPKPIVAAPKPPEPKPEPPLKAEPLPVVVAPIITAPADPRTRSGVLEQTTAEVDSHGPGKGGGAGTGSGTGLGAGDGSGVGPGSGGGTGGGPYRPGSGIEPPRLLREVKADYTEEARQRSISGEVVMEIVVRRDGSVGDVRILRGLGGGLNDRAAQAVRQWRFAPATRLGSPVDVIVEVGVEFRLR
jgi:periplasmic protein TonB